MTFSGAAWYWVSQSSMQSKNRFYYCYFLDTLTRANTKYDLVCTQTEWLIDFFACSDFPVLEFSLIIIQNQIWTSLALNLKTGSAGSVSSVNTQICWRFGELKIHQHGIHLITADIWYISFSSLHCFKQSRERWLNCTDSYSTYSNQRLHCISIPNSKKLRHEC